MDIVDQFLIGFMVAFLALIFLFVIFLPSIIAINKNHQDKVPIILVNVFGGFIFGFGWIVSLVWCFVEPFKRRSDGRDIDERRADFVRLVRLRDSKIISQIEFDKRSRDILS